MEEYRWNTQAMSQVFVLPQDAVTEQLRLASGFQWKVLLWIAAHGGKFDADLCADVIGQTADNCRDAVRYWKQAGILFSCDTAAETTPVTPPATKPVAVQPEPPAEKPPRPQMRDVVRAQQNDPAFAYLLSEVCRMFGHPLTPAEMETLLYLQVSVEMPPEVLLMIAEYAVQRGKPKIRYVERIAIDWSEEGICTIAAAEEYLCRLERREQAIGTVRKVCGIEKKTVTAKECDCAVRWIFDWKMPAELIKEAHTRCLEATGKYNPTYMDRLLATWQEDGVTAVSQIPQKKATKKKPGGSSRKKLTDYEKLVEGQLPVYRKKQKG